VRSLLSRAEDLPLSQGRNGYGKRLSLTTGIVLAGATHSSAARTPARDAAQASHNQCLTRLALGGETGTEGDRSEPSRPAVPDCGGRADENIADAHPPEAIIHG
jgi:hypothetical protein